MGTTARKELLALAERIVVLRQDQVRIGKELQEAEAQWNQSVGKLSAQHAPQPLPSATGADLTAALGDVNVTTIRSTADLEVGCG